MSEVGDLANALATELLAGTDFDVDFPDFSGADFQIPGHDGTNVLYQNVSKISTDDLTVGAESLNGSGTFDVLMKAFAAHLKAEYTAGRITGAQYTEAYIACTQAAMAQGVQFLLTRDTAYWQAINAQLAARTAEIQAIIARVQLESEKARLAVLKFEALNQEMTYAVNKIRLATESVQFDTAEYNLENILPKNLEMITQQVELIKEQTEAQRAQTMDTRTDGTTTITGSVGSQKALYAQQIISYIRDAEVKAAKIFSDAWTVMKTIDEGLAPPTAYANTNLDEILGTIKTNNDL